MNNAIPSQRVKILPSQPVTLSPDQIREISSSLRNLRHDINNRIMVIAAACEMAKTKPDKCVEMLAAIEESMGKPNRIQKAALQLTEVFERNIGITKQEGVVPTAVAA